MKKRIKIICAMIKFYIQNEELFSPVPINKLFMDHLNGFINRSNIQPSYAFHFLGSDGKIYDADEAFPIALDANQILDLSKTEGPLKPEYIWPIK